MSCAYSDESTVPRVQVDGFGFLPDDYCNIVRRYTITNKNNAAVRLITLGAGIQSITLPNKNADMADIILGFDDVGGYLRNRRIGRIVGYESSDEDCTTALDMVNWEAYILGEQVVMTHVSEQEMLTQVTYTWTDENRLHVDICAYATRCTPVDFGHHCLFNLAGHGMGAKELKNHYVTVNAERWIEQDVCSDSPTGVLPKIHKTVYDLRCATRLNAKKLRQVPGGGYDHHFCINNPSGEWCYRFHARVTHPNSGRWLEVLSNHPAMRLYTGNDLPNPEKIILPDMNNNDFDCLCGCLNEKMIGKDGLPYKRHGCFALIPQGYPKASEFKNFPSNILSPGKIYVHNLTYVFGVDGVEPSNVQGCTIKTPL